MVVCLFVCMFVCICVRFREQFKLAGAKFKWTSLLESGPKFKCANSFHLHFELCVCLCPCPCACVSACSWIVAATDKYVMNVPQWLRIVIPLVCFWAICRGIGSALGASVRLITRMLVALRR